MNTNSFYLESNTGTTRANILTTFDIYGDTYCTFSISNKNNGQDVYCAKLENGLLYPITNPQEKNLTNKIVKNLVNSIKGDVTND